MKREREVRIKMGKEMMGLVESAKECTQFLQRVCGEPSTLNALPQKRLSWDILCDTSTTGHTFATPLQLTRRDRGCLKSCCIVSFVPCFYLQWGGGGLLDVCEKWVFNPDSP